jgi:Neuralized
VQVRPRTENLAWKMSFHNRTGKRIELKNQGKTAIRNINEFNHGIVLSRHPLVDDVSVESFAKNQLSEFFLVGEV